MLIFSFQTEFYLLETVNAKLHAWDVFYASSALVMM